ncbi:RNA polymerase II C-terminal domain phosphatase-like 1 [Amborella trichopoda]|uniref:RNA polymerase II C-terminal domain phosphatase-like 1 n=1 Tax=Amborella trichopoda TaxID=13333 RepID=UPI0005D3BC2F|nr:RNA polymerase II C-terminal domain phosphatase-like 1 [Amborella trichopoda]|eukprot:XP_011624749.1 RNA polymerase II C-terminal domain phosphatase-like 1 [Amborella trichopoda]
MLHLGFRSILYHGDTCLGEVDVVPQNQNPQILSAIKKEIRISHLTAPSERCPPLAVLQTISPFGVCFKLKSSGISSDQSPMHCLFSACFRELRTAVVLFGEDELHLVAMQNKLEKFSCFWAFTVSPKLYASCLAMLNLRCLGIVFDLDETLIVANSMRSFEDRIDALQRKIGTETDPQRISGMSAEIKRYQEDKALLRHYSENDQVFENGRLVKVQMEEVPPLSDNHEAVVRPVVRLHERNIVLTRINPEIRDTSVLVRLRPAWEDLRSYLTAKGRKRFEVYVCTMAERDYALEMWRLLDPEAHLINPKQLLDRVVCVKSGSRKSLLNVFQDGICHPKMAMVIDDRLNVWEDKDQSRVHVVPAFAPYYAPQAEATNAVPILCVARNVACDVRGGFFKEFDENILRRVSIMYYEDNVADLPYTPDVSNYLIPEDAGAVMTGNRELPISEGMNDMEVEKRLNKQDENPSAEGTPRPFVSNHQELRESSLQNATFQSIPAGQAILRTPICLQKEEMNQKQLSRRTECVPQEPNGFQLEKQRPLRALSCRGVEGTAPYDRSLQSSHATIEEQCSGDDRLRQNHMQSSISSFSDEEMPSSRETVNPKDVVAEETSSVPVAVLREIGSKCGLKVEFKSVSNTTTGLQFVVEVVFTGEKIGEGTGRTRKEAQHQAAVNALRTLAYKYVEHISPDSGAVNGDLNNLSHGMDNGFLRNALGSSGSESSPRKEPQLNEQLNFMEDSKRAPNSISALQEPYTSESISLVFHDKSPLSTYSNKTEFHPQAEVAGQILRNGMGLGSERVKLQAAEEGRQNLQALTNRRNQWLRSLRSQNSVPTKRSQ